MYPFTHFIAGAYMGFFYWKDQTRRLLMFLLMGFFAISPDFDVIFGYIPLLDSFLGHRELMHSIIYALGIGLFCWLLTGKYWPGTLAVLTHIGLDVIDGTLRILPGLPKIGFKIWPYIGIEQLMGSALIGTILLTIMIIIVAHKEGLLKSNEHTN